MGFLIKIATSSDKAVESALSQIYSHYIPSGMRARHDDPSGETYFAVTPNRAGSYADAEAVARAESRYDEKRHIADRIMAQHEADSINPEWPSWWSNPFTREARKRKYYEAWKKKKALQSAADRYDIWSSYERSKQNRITNDNI